MNHLINGTIQSTNLGVVLLLKVSFLDNGVVFFEGLKMTIV